MDNGNRTVSAYCDDVLGTLDAMGLAKRIDSGELAASEVVEAAIARVRCVSCPQRHRYADV